MNDFASTTNSSNGILKDNYDNSATNAMKEAIKRRKEKLIFEGGVTSNPDYNSKDVELKDDR